MSLAVVHSRALDALRSPQVTVEVHLANGLPSFTLVGLADTEVKEARERVRAALQNSGLEFPAQQAHHRQPGAGRSAQGIGPLRPADRAGHPGGQRADRRAAAGGFEFAGELSLAGELRPVRGALAMALAAAHESVSPPRAMVLPTEQRGAGGARGGRCHPRRGTSARRGALRCCRGDAAVPLPRAVPAAGRRRRHRVATCAT